MARRAHEHERDCHLFSTRYECTLYGDRITEAQRPPAALQVEPAGMKKESDDPSGNTGQEAREQTKRTQYAVSRLEKRDKQDDTEAHAQWS